MRIVICGSMSFSVRMLAVAGKLGELGYEVTLPEHTDSYAADPGLVARSEGWNAVQGAQEKIEGDLIKRHFDEIERGDAVLVVNEDKNGIANYVGGNAFLEMGFAHVLGKPIFALNPLPDMPYSQELIAMRPTVLDGDVRGISGKVCDHTSVGMIVERDGKILLLQRRNYPFGFAPPAGHKDDDATFKDAACRELQEEVGLVAERLEEICSARHHNACRRAGGDWHDWRIFRVSARGELKADLNETKGAAWHSRDEVVALIKRTRAYSAGKVSEGEWQQSPGLEEFWVDRFVALGIASP